MFLNLNNLFFQNLQIPIQNNIIEKTFKDIQPNELLTQDNPFYNKIHNETKDIYLFLKTSIDNFHLIFEKEKLKDFEESLNFLEKISIPDKCVCAGVIDKIPGWRCVDCSKYENAIYCNDCYIKSKDLHKNHNVVFLYSSSGMCDCGDPDSLKIFCPDHSGPFSDQKQIDEYISKIFNKEILDKLKTFFETLFLRFSKYLILTEQCEYFCPDLYNEKFKDNNNEKDLSKDIDLLKSNFGIVFQNLITFLRLISQKNLGIFHLIANYLLKNHLENQKLGDEYMTTHRCVKISQNDIQLFYADKQKHICVCPFIRLFITNYRDNIKDQNKNEEFLLSFPHNYILRVAFCIVFFLEYKQIILNNNKEFINNRTQFYLEDGTELIAKKTHLIEDTYDLFYQNLLEYIKSLKIKDNNGGINEDLLDKSFDLLFHVYVDTKYFSKPKMRMLMTDKTLIMKRMIDVICLFHNQNEFKSIVPHPQFQNKGLSTNFLNFEFKLLDIIKEITMFIQWEKIEQLKDIFKYLINKILNQEKEGITQLKEDEYTYHIGLYRCFGIYINSFCFNYSFNNNCTLIESIEFFKKTFFESKNEIEIFVDLLLKDYFKLFGFIAGCKNNYFNYYNSVSSYSRLYSLFKEAYLVDFSLLKYLFVMSEKKIDIISYFKMSNIENVYSSFKKSIESKIENNDKKIAIEEEPKKAENTNNNEEQNTNNNEEQNTNAEIPIELLELLRNQNQRERNQLIQQFIYNRNYKNEDKSRDEYYCIMQWEFLLEILICFMKDDSCPFWGLMSIFNETVSSQTKRDLFNIVRNNKYAMQDLKNILKEKLIHQIISQGNLTDLQNITKKIDEYLQILFEQNNEFNKTLDELTYNKMNGETKMFYLKDDYLKYLDINYYLHFEDKSKAQRYILDFKKDIIKSYNYYYYNPSELTFEFFEKVYDKILLNKNNLELMIKILEKLLGNEKITEELDIKSVRNSLLPIILNYLSMFSVINSKKFIEFKLNNSDSINKLYELLSKCLEDNKNNTILEKDLEENVKEVKNQLNRYKIIYESLNSDLTKLNKYDYNTEIIEKLKEKENLKNLDKNSNIINLIPGDINKVDENKKKVKNIKNKYKNLMKRNANLFMDKVTSNEEMLNAIKDKNKNNENLNNSNNEIMCFFCRNPIKLDSFIVPYGKIGLLIEDYFFINSIKSTIRTEILKLVKKEEDNNKLYNNVKDNIYNDIYKRINSCGHYFHTSCFLEGCSKNNDENEENEFTCPLCLKKQNILIPPLNSFKEKYNFFKSENLNELFTTEIDIDKFKLKNDSDSLLFKDIIQNFLEKIDLNIIQQKNFTSFLDYKFPLYKGYFNFLENIFYINGTYFHKQQQIDNLKNINLSLRFISKTNPLLIKQIITFINNELINLGKGPEPNEYIYSHTDYMRYVDSFEKILLSLLILFNYEEIEETFKYIIYIYLPYFAFGFYFRDLMFKMEYNNLDKIHFKEKMNMNDLQNYLKNNNILILDYFKDFLKKLCLIKVISDNNDKNQNIINSFNELTLENLFALLNMDNLYKILIKNENNEIIFMDIINNLPKTFNENDVFYKLFGKTLEYKNVFNSIFINIKTNEKEESIIEKELIIQFSPIKFGFIHLDKNIFDWIERNLGKECDVCHQVTKKSDICLICGDKVCRDKAIEVINHTKKCGGKYCLFVDMNNMNIILFTSQFILKRLFPIYVNEAGVGPNGYEIRSEFSLSNEKLNQAIKYFVYNDFHIQIE